jgi:hypothetical protein
MAQDGESATTSPWSESSLKLMESAKISHQRKDKKSL